MWGGDTYAEAVKSLDVVDQLLAHRDEQVSATASTFHLSINFNNIHILSQLPNQISHLYL